MSETKRPTRAQCEAILALRKCQKCGWIGHDRSHHADSCDYVVVPLENTKQQLATKVLALLDENEALAKALELWKRFAAECEQRNVIVPLWTALLNEKAVEATDAALAEYAKRKQEGASETFT